MAKSKDKKWEYSRALENEVCQWLEAGATVQMMCSRVGLPSHVFYQWLKLGEDVVDDEGQIQERGQHPYRKFAQRVMSVKNVAELESLKKIRNESRWQAHAWFLERTRPNDYSKATQKHEHTVSGDIKVIIPDNGRDSK